MILGLFDPGLVRLEVVLWLLLLLLHLLLKLLSLSFLLALREALLVSLQLGIGVWDIKLYVWVQGGLALAQSPLRSRLLDDLKDLGRCKALRGALMDYLRQ